ncbi:MAG: hypothetical protein R3Y32_03545 [Bacillota bacterium]
MAKLKYQFEIPFEYDVPKNSIKKAMKKELIDSFGIEANKNTTALLEYLINNFFWEFFQHFNEEMLTVFSDDAKMSFGGEHL